MSFSWRYDLLDGARARAALDGVEVSRSCIVSGITVSSGVSDPEVILRLTEDPGFPGYGALLPTNNVVWTGATLQDVAIRSRAQKTNSVAVDLIYRKRGNGDSVGDKRGWTLEETGNISHVQTGSTADGVKQIQVFYKSGIADTVTTAPTGADVKNIQMTVMRPSRVLRATAHMTGDQWDGFKVPVRQTVGWINLTTWGSSKTGTWFHAPITIQTSDRNRSVSITLTFLENPLGWYGLGVYHSSIDGRIPRDIATETRVREYGPPNDGELNQRNGIVLASLYGEVDFSYFPFTPDDA